MKRRDLAEELLFFVCVMAFLLGWAALVGLATEEPREEPPAHVVPR